MPFLDDWLSTFRTEVDPYFGTRSPDRGSGDEGSSLLMQQLEEESRRRAEELAARKELKRTQLSYNQPLIDQQNAALFPPPPPDPGVMEGLGASMINGSVSNLQGAAEGLANTGSMIQAAGRSPLAQIIAGPMGSAMQPIGDFLGPMIDPIARQVAEPFQRAADTLSTMPIPRQMQDIEAAARANGGWGRNFGFDVAGMAPQMATTYATMAFAPEMAVPSMFLPAAGQRIAQGEQEGLSPEKAALAGLLSGTVEAATENAHFGTISRLTELVDGPALTSLMQVGKAMMGNVPQGGFEEALSQLGNELINMGVGSQRPPANVAEVMPILQRILYAGTVGGVGEGLGAGGPAVLNYLGNRGRGATQIDPTVPLPTNLGLPVNQTGVQIGQPPGLEMPPPNVPPPGPFGSQATVVPESERSFSRWSPQVAAEHAPQPQPDLPPIEVPEGVPPTHEYPAAEQGVIAPAPTAPPVEMPVAAAPQPTEQQAPTQEEPQPAPAAQEQPFTTVEKIREQGRQSGVPDAQIEHAIEWQVRRPALRAGMEPDQYLRETGQRSFEFGTPDAGVAEQTLDHGAVPVGQTATAQQAEPEVLHRAVKKEEVGSLEIVPAQEMSADGLGNLWSGIREAAKAAGLESVFGGFSPATSKDGRKAMSILTDIDPKTARGGREFDRAHEFLKGHLAGIEGDFAVHQGRSVLLRSTNDWSQSPNGEGHLNNLQGVAAESAVRDLVDRVAPEFWGRTDRTARSAISEAPAGAAESAGTQATSRAEVAGEEQVLHRETPGTLEGSIRFDPETRESTIRFLNGEASEEELAHHWRRNGMTREDEAAARKVMGLGKDGLWTRAKEELFAKRALLYSQSQVAPPKGWDRIVRSFREWLTSLHEWATGNYDMDKMSSRSRRFFERTLGTVEAPPSPARSQSRSAEGRRNFDRLEPATLASRSGYSQAVRAATSGSAPKQGGRPGLAKRLLTTFGEKGEAIGRLAEHKDEVMGAKMAEAVSAAAGLNRAIQEELKKKNTPWDTAAELKEAVNAYTDAPPSPAQQAALEKYDKATTEAERDAAWSEYRAAPDSKERAAVLADLPREVGEIASLIRREIDDASRRLFDASEDVGVPSGAKKTILTGGGGAREVGIGQYMRRTYRIHREGQAYIDEVRKSSAWAGLVPQIQEMVVDSTAAHVVETAEEIEAADRPALEQFIRTGDQNLLNGLNLPVAQRQQLYEARQQYMDPEGLMLNLLQQQSPDSPTGRGKGDSGAGIGTIDTGIFKEKGEVPKPLRDLYGQDVDPLVRFVNTMAGIHRALATADMNAAILEEGLSAGWIVKGAPSSVNAPEGMVQIPGEFTRSPLAGHSPTIKYYAPVHVVEAIVAAKETIDKSYLAAVSYVVKTMMTVFNEPVHWRNAIANVLLVMASGNIHSALFLPKAWGELTGISSGKKVLKGAKSAAGLGNITLEELLGEGLSAKKHGVIGTNVDLGVINGMRKRAINVAQPGVAARVLDAARRGPEWMYQFEDDLPKMVSWLAERYRIEKIHPDWSQEKVKAVAAERVKNTMPNYRRLLGIARKAAKNKVLSPFVGFVSEIPRNVYKTLEIGFKDEIAYGIKTKNAAAVTSGVVRIGSVAAAIALSKTITTVALTAVAGLLGYDVLDDDETEKYRAAMPFFQRNNEFIILRDKKDKSKIHVLDFSFMDSYGVLKKPFRAFMAQKGSTVDKFTAALMQGIESYAGLELLPELALDLSRGQNEAGRTIIPKGADGWTRVQLMALETARRLVLPPFNPYLNVGMGMLKMQGDFGRVYDTGSEALNLFGPRVMTWKVDDLAKGAARTYAATLDEAKITLGSASKMKGEEGKTTSPLTQYRGHLWGDAGEHSFENAAHNLDDAVQSLRAMGKSDDDIYELLTGEHVTQQDASAALEGYDALLEAAKAPSRPKRKAG